jgi:hypothetical protein
MGLPLETGLVTLLACPPSSQSAVRAASGNWHGLAGGGNGFRTRYNDPDRAAQAIKHCRAARCRAVQQRSSRQPRGNHRPAQILIRGTLGADGTLVLEEKPALPAGRVEVLIRALPEPNAGTESWWEYLQRSRAELIAQGHTFRTREEIDGDRGRGQAADEERRQSIGRLQSAQE